TPRTATAALLACQPGVLPPCGAWRAIHREAGTNRSTRAEGVSTKVPLSPRRMSSRRLDLVELVHGVGRAGTRLFGGRCPERAMLSRKILRWFCHDFGRQGVGALRRD